MSYSILRRRTCSSKADNSSSMVTLRLLRSGEGRLCGLYHRENLLTGYHGNGRNILSFLSIHRFYGGQTSLVVGHFGGRHVSGHEFTRAGPEFTRVITH